jgi:hypothetical protein
MMQTDEEKLEYRKRVLPGYAEFYEMSDEDRETYVVNLVNEALLKEGMAPIERLLTDEEVEIACQELYGPKKRSSFLSRLCRAWAILWAQDN